MMKNSLSLQTHDILRILFSFIALLTDLSRLDLMFTFRGFSFGQPVMAAGLDEVGRRGRGPKFSNTHFLKT